MRVLNPNKLRTSLSPTKKQPSVFHQIPFQNPSLAPYFKVLVVLKWLATSIWQLKNISLADFILRWDTDMYRTAILDWNITKHFFCLIMIFKMMCDTIGYIFVVSVYSSWLTLINPYLVIVVVVGGGGGLNSKFINMYFRLLKLHLSNCVWQHLYESLTKFVGSKWLLDTLFKY